LIYCTICGFHLANDSYLNGCFSDNGNVCSPGYQYSNGPFIMKIGILATGMTPESLLPQYGSYADMFIRLLQPVQAGLEYQVFDVRNGDIPASAQDCDGWIITGSRHSVYEPLQWIADLKDFIRLVAVSSCPMVGICFGHQLMAEALGGKVEKYDGGWGLGIHEYRISADFAARLDNLDSGRNSDLLSINAVHQDQVVRLPQEAEVIARSDFCEYAGLSYYKGRMVSLQAHPEFTLEFERDLLTDRGGKGIPLEAAKAGIESAAGGCIDSQAIARWIMAVLNKHYSG
jgi:GMP synthase-like glutamine amidotransferase